MAFNFGRFVTAAAVFLAASCTAETLQLQPTHGILIPAPLAESIRIARSAYGGGGGGGGAPSYSAPAAPSYSAPAAPSYSAPAAPAYAAPAAPAYGPPAAPSYEPASIPAPPCPKNYLFSCQPSLQPVPCSSPSASYGSQGAYSQYVPQYAAPMVRELY